MAHGKRQIHHKKTHKTHTHMRSLFCSDMSNNLIELKLGGFFRQTDIKSPDDIIPKQCSAVLCAVQLSTRKIDFMQGINCHEGGGQGGRIINTGYSLLATFSDQLIIIHTPHCVWWCPLCKTCDAQCHHLNFAKYSYGSGFCR